MTNQLRGRFRTSTLLAILFASMVGALWLAPIVFSPETSAAPQGATDERTADMSDPRQSAGAVHGADDGRARGATGMRGGASHDPARGAAVGRAPAPRSGVKAVAGARFAGEANELLAAILPDAPIGRAALNAMDLANSSGPHAERDYQTALKELRKYGADAVPMLSDAYDRLPVTSYLDRQLVADTLGRLDSHEAVSKLGLIAAAPLPARAADLVAPHGDIEREQEMVIRYLAIDGLQRFANRGVQEADTALAGLIQSMPRGLKERAVVAYVEASGSHDERVQLAAQILPQEDRWMASVATLSARDMPVAKPPRGWLDTVRQRKNRPARSATPRTSRPPADWAASAQVQTASE